MVTSAVIAIESTILATAVNSIASDIGGFAQFPWLFCVYLLTQAVTVPVYAKLADAHGRKKIILIGIGAFLLGSVLCGFAWNMTALIVFRALQGLGAGAVQPMSMTIAGDIYSVAERARVVVATGAIETPRLLVASRLGNDHVRRHLQGHAVTLLVGRTCETVPTFRGPGHSIATMDFVHDGGPAGGGVLFDAFAPYPPSRGEKNACRNAGPRPQSTRPEQSAWDDPASSAADADGLVWRSKNVYVMAHSSRPRVALMSGAWNRRPLIP